MLKDHLGSSGMTQDRLGSLGMGEDRLKSLDRLAWVRRVGRIVHDQSGSFQDLKGGSGISQDRSGFSKILPGRRRQHHPGSCRIVQDRQGSSRIVQYLTRISKQARKILLGSEGEVLSGFFRIFQDFSGFFRIVSKVLEYFRMNWEDPPVRLQECTGIIGIFWDLSGSSRIFRDEFRIFLGSLRTCGDWPSGRNRVQRNAEGKTEVMAETDTEGSEGSTGSEGESRGSTQPNEMET